MPGVRRRCLGYARVSSAEQAIGSSLHDQQEAIRAYAEGRGLEPPIFFVEAESAVHEKIERREQMSALLATVRHGDVVVCDKMDRWSRDAEFSYRTVREILAAGASFFAVADRIDPSTSEGDTAMSFRILFAREEHKRIKERMVGTRRILRDQGYYVEGLPPFGYRRAPRGTKGVTKNVLVVDEEEADLVRRTFALCIAGQSLARISDALDLTRDRIVSVLSTRTYLGEIESTTGAWIPAKHAAIIAPSVFVAARDALEGRRHGGARPREAPAETDDWILRDVAVCLHCAARMSAAYAGTHERRRYYYRCSHRCTPRHVPVKLVEMAAVPLVLARLADLRDELAREPPAPLRSVDAHESKRVRLQARRARLVELYADGVTTREAMLAAVRQVDDDLLRLAAVARPESALRDPATRRTALRGIRAIERAWRHAGPKVQRQIVGHLALRMAIAADEAPVPTWRSVDDLALDVA